MKPTTGEGVAPQCTTAAQCLKELARVMEQFGIKSTYGALNSKYVVTKCEYNVFPDFTTPSNWQFALAEVEGKPVFIGDTLYLNDGTRMHVVRSLNGSAKFLGMRSAFDNQMTNDSSVSPTSVQDLSWNPPKPATVMVELTVSQAELGAKLGLTTDIAQACKVALEKL